MDVLPCHPGLTHSHDNHEPENPWVPQNMDKARTRIWDGSSAPYSWETAMISQGVRPPRGQDLRDTSSWNLPAPQAVLSTSGSAPRPRENPHLPAPSRRRREHCSPCTYRFCDSGNPCLLCSGHHGFRTGNPRRHRDVVRDVLQDLQLQIP